MIIRIGNTDYDKIKNIDFCPETDVIGKSLPINRFTVDVCTDDPIEPNTLIYLLDGNADVWAYYWLTDAYYIDTGWKRIIAQSTIMLLDRVTMPAKMYDGTDTFNDVIGEIFQSIQTMFPSMTVVSVDASLASTVISGYAPEQKARDRLLWVCFCARAYVKTFFNSYTEILPVDSTETIVPADKTFWKPEVKANDYVTEIKIRAYTYTLTQTDPARTDKFVKIGNDVYIETSQDFSIQNQSIPVTVAENVVNLQKVTLVNPNNANAILADLAEYYFSRFSVSAEFVNNGEFLPGEKVIVNNTENLYAGYIKSAKFTFGHNAKSAVEMQATVPIEADTLTIECVYNTTVLATYAYLLPVGYALSVENQYLDMYNNGVRTIFRPENEYATGTVVSGGTTIQEPYEVAIEAENEEIYLLIVESVSEDDEIVTIS